MWMQLPQEHGGHKIVFTHDARNLPWSAFEPSLAAGSSVMTLALASGQLPTVQLAKETRALGMLPASDASVIVATEPLWAAGFAALLLGEVSPEVNSSRVKRT